MKEPQLLSCDECGMSYMSTERKKHKKHHDAFLNAKAKYPFIANYYEREEIKRLCYLEISKPFSDEQLSYAVSLIQVYFSRDYLKNPEQHTSFDNYVIDKLNNRNERPYSDFSQELVDKLLSIYG